MYYTYFLPLPLFLTHSRILFILVFFVIILSQIFDGRLIFNGKIIHDVRFFLPSKIHGGRFIYPQKFGTARFFHHINSQRAIFWKSFLLPATVFAEWYFLADRSYLNAIRAEQKYFDMKQFDFSVESAGKGNISIRVKLLKQF